MLLFFSFLIIYNICIDQRSWSSAGLAPSQLTGAQNLIKNRPKFSSIRLLDQLRLANQFSLVQESFFQLSSFIPPFALSLSLSLSLSRCTSFPLVTNHGLGSGRLFFSSVLKTFLAASLTTI